MAAKVDFIEIGNQTDFLRDFQLRDNSIATATLLSGGSGYTFDAFARVDPPTLDGGKPALIVPIREPLTGVISDVQIQDPGAGFDEMSPPNAEILGGGGTGAFMVLTVGNPLPINEDDELIFTVKQNNAAAQEMLKIGNKAPLTGIELLPAYAQDENDFGSTSGEFRIHLPRDQLKMLPPDTYVHDLVWIRAGTILIERIWFGTIQIVQGITTLI